MAAIKKAYTFLSTRKIYSKIVSEELEQKV